MTTRRRVLLSRLALAGIPLWFGPLAWWLAWSPTRVLSCAGQFLATIQVLCVFVFLAALVALVVCPFFLFVREYRFAAFSWLACSAAFAVSFVGGLMLGLHIHHENLFRLTERAQPLVDAITAYQAEHGHPPASLDDLVPKYIERIPTTGIGAWPEFGYSVENPERRHGNEWVLVVTPPCAVMGFDSFYYYPRQNYDEVSFGGGTRQIGTWVYFWD